ncbi:cya1 [Symbiodinium necroappetens]|uniref:Cya1 protein n=1 Tax=Symbiodinium necroappetens TaxID=1628268 RepID=A0A812KJ37_9DINO|nr:cya1 [Symbiodinium necroappetens]
MCCSFLWPWEAAADLRRTARNGQTALQAAQARGQDAVLEVFAAWEASQSVPDASSPEEQRKKRRSEEMQIGRAVSIATQLSDHEEGQEPPSISYLDNVLRYEFRRGGPGEDARAGTSIWNESETSRGLLRSQSWRSLAAAEAEEGTPTVWTAEGLEKQTEWSQEWDKGPIQEFCENLANKRSWTGTYVFFTAYALFAIDIDAMAGDKSSRIGVAIVTTLVAIAFLFELVVHCIGKKGYMTSAFFMLDLVAFISLIPDTILMQLATDGSAFVAGRSSRLTRMLRLFGRSARAARLNRFGRIARIAAFMPKIQELSRFWGHKVEDDDAARVLEKKLYRVFCFLDEDMDSWVAKSALDTCKDKLFQMAHLEKKKSEWGSKLRMLAATTTFTSSKARKDDPHSSASNTTGLDSQTPADLASSFASRPPSPRSLAKKDGAVIGSQTMARASDNKPYQDQVDYPEFRDAIMSEPPLVQWLKNAVIRQLKRGNNMQAVRQRNAEYIGVKVAMAILFIIAILSYVEPLMEDTSLNYGFVSMNSFVGLTTGSPAVNTTIPDVIRRQVATWTLHEGWARPERPLLYLDLQRKVYCNSLVGSNERRCDAPLSEALVWGQTKRLDEVDVDVISSEYRQMDLLLMRYPDFDNQDITAEDLEERTEAVALFLNRADTVATARDSIITTWVVLFLIVIGISLLTRDLTYLSKNLLKPLVELADEVESITRLQLAATNSATTHSLELAQNVSSEIRLLRRRFDSMKTAIRSWGKYVPWPVVQLMMRKDAEANIEVSERKVTMFFSDIASFTTIVESLPPKSSLLLLSRYFQEMSKIVDAHGGIVVEFIGDAILCIYGAPVVNDSHATVAVKAAVEMLHAVGSINAWLDRRELPRISIRCGVHTGKVLVGNMGMQSRIKYGIVGDECSMPGRLEELNKTYGTQLLVSETTHTDLDIEGFVSRPIDFIRRSADAEESEQIFEVWKANRRPSKASLEEKAADLYTEKTPTCAATAQAECPKSKVVRVKPLHSKRIRRIMAVNEAVHEIFLPLEEEVCDTSATVFLSILCFFGLAVSFFGYRIYKVAFAFFAFLVGFGLEALVGSHWISEMPEEATTVKKVTVLVCCVLWGTVAAVLARRCREGIEKMLGIVFGIFLGLAATCLLVYALQKPLDSALGDAYKGWEQFGGVTLGVPLALLAGYLCRTWVKHLIMIVTAFFGSWAAWRCASSLLRCAEVESHVLSRHVINLLIVIGLGVLGLVAQILWQPRGERKVQERTVAGGV